MKILDSFSHLFKSFTKSKITVGRNVVIEHTGRRCKMHVTDIEVVIRIPEDYTGVEQDNAEAFCRFALSKLPLVSEHTLRGSLNGHPGMLENVSIMMRTKNGESSSYICGTQMIH